jgi:hypothetical protein
VVLLIGYAQRCQRGEKAQPLWMSLQELKASSHWDQQRSSHQCNHPRRRATRQLSGEPDEARVPVADSRSSVVELQTAMKCRLHDEQDGMTYKHHAERSYLIETTWHFASRLLSAKLALEDNTQRRVLHRLVLSVVTSLLWLRSTLHVDNTQALCPLRELATAAKRCKEVPHKVITLSRDGW